MDDSDIQPAFDLDKFGADLKAALDALANYNQARAVRAPDVGAMLGAKGETL